VPPVEKTAPVAPPAPVVVAPPTPAVPPVEKTAPVAPPAPVVVAPPSPVMPPVKAETLLPESVLHVPLTDQTGSGSLAMERPPAPPQVDEAVPEAIGVLGGVREVPVPIETPARLATGSTPDLRLADELMSRADAVGETVDADLAAALDRLSPISGSGPTPVSLSLDLPGLGASPKEFVTDIAGSSVAVDPAAEARLRDLVNGSAGEPVPPAETPKSTPVRAAAGTLPLEAAPVVSQTPRAVLGPASVSASAERTTPPRTATPAAATPPQPAPQATELPAEPARPYVRGRAAERRRPLSRFGRFDAPTPPDAQDAGVPRAFDEGRPAPLPRPVPDFDLLTRPEPSRRAVVPVLIGVVGGLIVGLAGGYWLGSRSPAPAPAAAARTAAVAPAVQQPVASVAAAPSAQPGRASATSAAPSTAAPPPPAAPEPAPPASAPAERGAIAVVATQQANVYLDGERQGMTPRNLRNVPLGRHTIRVTRPGYAPQEQTVVLTAEEPTARMTFTLRPVGATSATGTATAPAFRSVLTVLVESNPSGALISIDGRELAPTPLTIRQLRPGTHTLELRLPGYKTWTQRLTVAVGDNRRITATLERDTPR
jgi:hypothetical protein